MDNGIPIDITPDKSLIQKLGLVGYRGSVGLSRADLD